MFAEHRDAENRYTELRKSALESAQNAYAKQGAVDIKATLITGKSLEASKLWKLSKTRQVDWDWLEGYSAFKFRYPKRFEIALWKSESLICLSIGRPTYRGSALRLDVVEALPSDLGDRPQVFNMILVAYGIYARFIGASEIRIMNPINDEVKDYYKTFGYTYVAKEDYLYKKVF